MIRDEDLALIGEELMYDLVVAAIMGDDVVHFDQIIGEYINEPMLAISNKYMSVWNSNMSAEEKAYKNLVLVKVSEEQARRKDKLRGEVCKNKATGILRNLTYATSAFSLSTNVGSREQLFKGCMENHFTKGYDIILWSELNTDSPAVIAVTQKYFMLAIEGPIEALQIVLKYVRLIDDSVMNFLIQFLNAEQLYVLQPKLLHHVSHWDSRISYHFSVDPNKAYEAGRRAYCGPINTLAEEYDTERSKPVCIEEYDKAILKASVTKKTVDAVIEDKHQTTESYTIKRTVATYKFNGKIYDDSPQPEPVVRSPALISRREDMITEAPRKKDLSECMPKKDSDGAHRITVVGAHRTTLPDRPTFDTKGDAHRTILSGQQEELSPLGEIDDEPSLFGEMNGPVVPRSSVKRLMRKSCKLHSDQDNSANNGFPPELQIQDFASLGVFGGENLSHDPITPMFANPAEMLIPAFTSHSTGAIPEFSDHDVPPQEEKKVVE